MTVKIASTAPDDDANGLTAIRRRLIDSPTTTHLVLAVVDCSKTTLDHDKNDTIPTARFRHIEVLDDKAGQYAELLRSVHEGRTGLRKLPFAP